MTPPIEVQQLPAEERERILSELLEQQRAENNPLLASPPPVIDPTPNPAALSLLEGEQEHTLTVDGIQVTLNRAMLADWDTAETLASIQDEGTAEEAKFVASVKLVRKVFGEDWPRIKTELAAKHDGMLPVPVVMDFFATCLQNLGDEGKNS